MISRRPATARRRCSQCRREERGSKPERPCRFVAPAVTRSVLLLLLVVGPEQNAEPRPGQPMTRPVVRRSGAISSSEVSSAVADLAGSL
jgi:hypothetical protein